MNLLSRGRLSRRAFVAGANLLLSGGAAFADTLISSPGPLPQHAVLKVGYVKVAHLTPMGGLEDALAPLGVELQTSEFGRFADVRTAISTGSLDAGFIGPSDLPVLISQGVTSVVGLMGVGSSPQYPTVRDGVKADSWADLQKVKLGVPSGSMFWLQMVATIVESGLRYSDFDIVSIQGAGINYVQALRKGDVQAYIFSEPWASVPEAEKFGHEVKALDYSTSNMVGSELGLLVATKDALGPKREVMRRFVWAYLSAENAMAADKAKFAAGIRKMTGMDAATADRIAGEMKLGGVVDAPQLMRLAKFMKNMGLLTKDVSAEVSGYHDPSFVKLLQS